MLSELGLSQSAEGIVEHYGDLLDGFLADEQDRQSLSFDAALTSNSTHTRSQTTTDSGSHERRWLRRTGSLHRRRYRPAV